MPSPILVLRGPIDPDALMERIGDWEPAPGYNVYTKPLVRDGNEFGVFEMTPWQDVWDDVRRYGLFVALHNAFWHMWHYDKAQD